jgi:hypothetical protein
VTSWWFSLDIHQVVSSTNKTEILLKVALNTITLTIYIGILHKENVRKIKNSIILKNLLKDKGFTYNKYFFWHLWASYWEMGRTMIPCK